MTESNCAQCGMMCRVGEYHPYAACLMFTACRDGNVVRANLEAIRRAPEPAIEVSPITAQEAWDRSTTDSTAALDDLPGMWDRADLIGGATDAIPSDDESVETLRMVLDGRISGRISEWPQLKPAIANLLRRLSHRAGDHGAAEHGIERSTKATFVPCDCGCGRSCCAHCGVDVGFVQETPSAPVAGSGEA